MKPVSFTSILATPTSTGRPIDPTEALVYDKSSLENAERVLAAFLKNQVKNSKALDELSSKFVEIDERRKELDALFKKREAALKAIDERFTLLEKTLTSATGLDSTVSRDLPSPPIKDAATGGAGTDTDAALIETDDEEEAFIELFSPKAKPSSFKPKPKASSLELSFIETRHQIAKLTHHPRVAVWQESKEKGLAYYDVRKKPGFINDLSDEEMILTHQLPSDLLLLALHPHYGTKKKLILTKEKVIEEHFECPIYINAQPYNLEVSIDSGELFHFYAKKVPPELATEMPLRPTFSKIESIKKLTGSTIFLTKDGDAQLFTKDNAYQIPIKK